MDLRPERLFAPVRDLVYRAHQLGKNVLEFQDSQKLTNRLLDEHDAEQLQEAAALKQIASITSDQDSEVHQQKIIAHILARSFLRKSETEGFISEDDILRLKTFMYELPETESFDTIGLTEEEATQLRRHIDNY
jgi:hypothetical protein